MMKRSGKGNSEEEEKEEVGGVVGGACRVWMMRQ